MTYEEARNIVCVKYCKKSWDDAYPELMKDQAVYVSMHAAELYGDNIAKGYDRKKESGLIKAINNLYNDE